MDRKLFGFFSARQVTAIIMTAIVAPSALYGAVQVSQVAITDPNTGNRSYIDPGRKLSVYDPIAGYANMPGNIVNIVDFSSNDDTVHSIYTIPSGKTLIIKSITSNYFGSKEGTNIYLYIYDDSGNNLWNYEGAHTVGTVSASFDAGIVVRQGPLSLGGGGNSASFQRTYIQGYLVPSGVFPPAGSAEAASHYVSSGRRTKPAKPQ